MFQLDFNKSWHSFVLHLCHHLNPGPGFSLDFALIPQNFLTRPTGVLSAHTSQDRNAIFDTVTDDCSWLTVTSSSEQNIQA